MGVTTTQSTNGGATWRQIHKRAIYKRRADSSTPAFFVHQRWDLTSAAAGRYKARYLQVEGVGVELAQYQSFASNELMDAGYQEAVDTYGVEPTGSCESGPNETTWSVGDESFGRVQCAPQQVGIRVDWTDDRLSILSTLIDFDGDYQNAYQAWLEAGPNP